MKQGLVDTLVALVAAIGLVALVAFALRLTEAADHPIPPPLKKAPPTAFECRFTELPITERFRWR